MGGGSGCGRRAGDEEEVSFRRRSVRNPTSGGVLVPANVDATDPGLEPHLNHLVGTIDVLASVNAAPLDETRQVHSGQERTRGSDLKSDLARQPDIDAANAHLDQHLSGAWPVAGKIEFGSADTALDRVIASLTADALVARRAEEKLRVVVADDAAVNGDDASSIIACHAGKPERLADAVLRGGD